MEEQKTKICVKCQKTKLIDEFYQNPKGNGNRIGTCNECRKIAARKNYEIRYSNPEFVKKSILKKREWVAKNQEKARQTRRQNYINNKERDIKKSKEYYAANKEKLFIARKKWEKDHPEYKKKKLASLHRWRKSQNGKNYHRNRAKTDPIYRIKCRLRCRLKDALRAGASSKSIKTIELLGCTPDFLKTYLESMFYDGMNWDNMGSGLNKWQIDHIKPVGLFDLCDILQQKNCFHYTNLQPLWGKDHLEKTKNDLRQIRTNK